MFRKKKKNKEQEKQKAQQSPPPEDKGDENYDQWIDHTKSTATQNLPPVDDTYDDWIDDAAVSSNPKVEDEYDDWGTSDHHLEKPEQPAPDMDIYEVGGDDVGNQEYEEVEEEGDIFGFDNKKGSSVKHTATSPSWVNKPPPVKGTPPSAKRVISAKPPQDDNLEYEDVVGDGDIFGFDKKKGSPTSPTSPSWANKAPAVKGMPPSIKRPMSMQQPPDLPKSQPPSERPKSMQSPTYINVSKKDNVQNPEEPASYEVPLNQMNVDQQVEGESYEEMDDLDLKPTYVNVTSQDVGGESYEEMDDLDLNKSTPTSPAPDVVDYYEDTLPDNDFKKPQITATIAERQQQLQKKETKEPPKKRGLAADYQKMKFEMLTQKFKEIDSGETKPEPMTSEKKKATWPPKKSANDEATPAKGTVTSLTRGFQPSIKAKDKVNMKGLLWHKAPGRNKYTEEHCELDGSNLKIFRNKNDSNPYFTINTLQCELASAPEEYEKKNVFKLTAGASRDYFGAFNAGEMKAWMNALKTVVKTSK